MTTTSAQVLTMQRPRFQVEGRDEPQLASDLLWLEVRHDEAGLSTLEMRLNNHGQADDGEESGYRWFDDRVLQLGRQLKVAAGEEDNEGLLFSGRITAIAGRFHQDRAPEVIVRAEDAAFQLRLGQRTRTFEEAADHDIASQVARDHGLEEEGSPEGPTHTQVWQVNQSDLAFLRDRARAVDGRILVADTKLRFEPRRSGAAPEPIALTTLRELLSFEAGADLAHQRTEVRVHGWSVADKDAIHESAGRDVVSAESAGGRTGPSVMEELGWPAVEHHHLEVPSTSEEARRIAETMMRRRARRFVTGRGVTAGTPKLRVGMVVDIADAGPWFSGRYTVASVRHTFDVSVGLRTWFVGERTDLGGRG